MLHHSGCDIFVPNVVHMNDNVLIHTHTSLGEGVPTKLLHHVPSFPPPFTSTGGKGSLVATLGGSALFCEF